jgi:hypothetical protein
LSTNSNEHSKKRLDASPIKSAHNHRKLVAHRMINGIEQLNNSMAPPDAYEAGINKGMNYPKKMVFNS